MTLLVVFILAALDLIPFVASRSQSCKHAWISAITISAIFALSVAIAKGIGWWSMLILVVDAVAIWALMLFGVEKVPLADAIKPSLKWLAPLTAVLTVAAFLTYFSGLARATAPVVLDQMGMFITSLVVISATSLAGFDHSQVPSLSNRDSSDPVEDLWRVWRRLICTAVLAILVIGGYSATMIGDPNWQAVFTPEVIVAMLTLGAVLVGGLIVLQIDHDMVVRPGREIATRVIILAICVINTLIWLALPSSGLRHLSPVSWSAIIPLLFGAFLLIPEDYWGNILLNGWKYRIFDIVIAVSIGVSVSTFTLSHIGTRFVTDTGIDVERVYQNCIVGVVQLASIVWCARALGTVAAVNQKPKRMLPTLAQSLTIDTLMYTWLLAASVVGIATKLSPGPNSSPVANLIIVGAVAGIVLLSWRGHIESEKRRTLGQPWREDFTRGLIWQRRGQLFAVLMTAIPAAGAAIFGTSG